MNILPKKSWHVRNKKNIARVRRDEAEAKRTANLEQARILQVEHEVRARDLQLRSGRTGDESESKSINLFEGYKDRQDVANQLNDARKKREEDEWQERVGITKRLVRSGDLARPWYWDTSRTTLLDGESEIGPSRGGNSMTGLITKMYDPMTAIKCAEDMVRTRRKAQTLQRSAPVLPPKTEESDSSIEILHEVESKRKDVKPPKEVSKSKTKHSKHRHKSHSKRVRHERE